MTLMRVAAHDGHVLTYNTDDAENVHIETPRDVHETGVTERGAVLRELGQEHLVLRIDFKPGKGPRWVDQATAALPDLRVGSELLRAALDAEGIPADVASRIWNRFFYGHPAGLDDEGSIILRNAGHGRVERHDDGRIVIHHREADEEQKAARQTFPAGQSPAERFAAVMDSAMLASVRTHFGDKMADRMKQRMERDDG